MSAHANVLQACASAGRSLEFAADMLIGLPEGARRYLAHAIAPGTSLATSVRLQMHGQIKLHTWRNFTAEQIICTDGNMRWNAETRLFGMPVRGLDQLSAGAGSMRWNLFGLIPLIHAAGEDVTRSTCGRVAAEAVWLPSRLLAQATPVSWEDAGSHLRVDFDVCRRCCSLDLGIASSGQVESLSLERWGNPDGGKFHSTTFGGYVGDERCFGGYTIPTRLRIGWYVGSTRFEAEGEFFRVVVDDAVFA